MGRTTIEMTIIGVGDPMTLTGTGSGLISTLVDALADRLTVAVDIQSYEQHLLGGDYVTRIRADVHGAIVDVACSDPSASTAAINCVLQLIPE
jgi:hypothetical protein